MNCSVVDIRNICISTENATQRVCADVNGIPVWFESDGAPLRVCPEAFASAFLIPAMKFGVPLRVDREVSNGWKHNIDQLQALFSRWWNFPAIEIEAETQDLSIVPGRTALFFSAGVDSFYSLLKSEIEVDELVYVFGFDLALDEAKLFRKVRQHLQAVANAAGKPLRIVKTNLREHPLMEQVDWEKTHGGALAGVAHSLDGVSSVVVSSSYARVFAQPWGSHWQSDRFWSSEQMELAHFGDRVLREDKLAQILDDPLVRQHLRVCWKNKNEHLNCCECEKCVRMMILLDVYRKLDPFTAFDFEGGLAGKIQKVRYVQAGLWPVYEDYLARNLSREIKQEVRALLRRSRFRLLRKSIGKTWGSVIRGDGR